jgi:hypothetical protein
MPTMGLSSTTALTELSLQQEFPTMQQNTTKPKQIPTQDVSLRKLIKIKKKLSFIYYFLNFTIF